MKKMISLLLSIVLMFGVSVEAFAAYTEDRARAYESDGCTVTYTVQNDWDGNQQISMSVTNNSGETLRNWALKFDCAGEIADIWNAAVVRNTDGLCVIKNNGYNYEINPDGTVEFGFQLR
ncbi:MAG: cellulose-binding domain-containing protein [Oscillospiraceae bacterium]|nr:cellulose-binding domain-containing protein [Oscillospiraceae bacterium]